MAFAKQIFTFFRYCMSMQEEDIKRLKDFEDVFKLLDGMIKMLDEMMQLLEDKEKKVSDARRRDNKPGSAQKLNF
ncbi:MAG: hypothetical protein KatS3mg031_0945 [Chitinophagales bacterium]|nr:MAG: hypothetical protein KatS3mg031_0945 [Chitinophagales bacterium]